MENCFLQSRDDASVLVGQRQSDARRKAFRQKQPEVIPVPFIQLLVALRRCADFGDLPAKLAGAFGRILPMVLRRSDSGGNFRFAESFTLLAVFPSCFT